LVEKIGEVGMGVVWKAEDTKLSRLVAIKVLPAGLAEDKQRLARFEREARTLATLNHPNVAAIHGFELVEGVHFLVLELVDGLSLAQMIHKTGPLPVQEAMDVCRQVAEGLEAAHGAGVIHRDLKPGNVIVTEDGKAKVLDFGLAKGIDSGDASSGDPSSGPAALSMSPTATFGGTQDGVVLGTAPYMSPEQARGKRLDRRTDIFSFGSLLFECLTGKAAFPGETVTDTLSAILQNDPDWEALPPRTPRRVRELMERCLEKSPRDRLHDIADARIDLEKTLAGREWTTSGIQRAEAGLPAATAAGSRRRRVRSVVAIAGVLSTILLAGWLGFHMGSSRAIHESLQAELTPPPGVSLSWVGSAPLALSPQGDRLAFLGESKEPVRIMIRSLADGEVRTLEGTSGASFPFWSPDGRWIAFFADEKLKKIQAGGGPVQVLADAHAGRGGTWSRDGVIVFAPDIPGPLLRIPDAGGAPEPATTAPDAGVSNRNPWFLADGDHFLFTVRAYATEPFGRMAVGSLHDPGSRIIVQDASNAQVTDGTLFYVKGGNLLAQAFDEERLAPEGATFPVASGLDYYNARDLGTFSVAGETLVYRKRTRRQTQLAWFDRHGRELESLGEPGFFVGNSLVSGDGSKVALLREEDSGTGTDVWVMDLKRKQLVRSTFLSNPTGFTVALSPSGDRLAVKVQWGGAERGQIAWTQSVTGEGAKEEIPKLASPTVNLGDWSPDGRILLGYEQRLETSQDLVWFDLEAGSEVKTLSGNKFTETNPCFMPGGRWVAYQSDESGRSEIYLVDFPDAKRKLQISKSGGYDPVCNRDPAGILCSGPEGIVFAPVSLDDPVKTGSAEVLVDAGTANRSFAGTPVMFDGQRFLALKYASDPPPEPLRLVRNWKSLLARNP
ncbi:MAG TPA: protein kinase, partial [Candidatus Saccharimonadales bacterium]|nr:protein kinase [Candidatus Saccharimonadales bacterium]